MRFRYTDEMDSFIRDNREGRDLYGMTELFNGRFGTSVTVSAMRSRYKALGIGVGVRRPTYTREWPREVVEFLRAHNAGMSVKEMKELLNRTFGTSYTEGQVRAYRKNHGLPSGVDARFRKGSVPWSAGKTIEEICRTSEALARVRGTHYRKGHSPHNQVPVGTEIERDGYVWVKTGEPNHWRAKHRIVYERANGRRLGRDEVITFLDGDPTNMDPDNLVPVTNRENLVMNRCGLRSSDPEVTRTGVAVARLAVAIERREDEERAE